MGCGNSSSNSRAVDQQELKSTGPQISSHAKGGSGQKPHVVVVGHGPVGQALISGLVEKGRGKFKISVLCEEPYPAYLRVKLSTFFEHRRADKLALTTEDWCRENGVELVYGQATKVDRKGKLVHFTANKSGDKGSLAYDKCVFSTGSKPFVPPIPGIAVEKPGIFVYRTIDHLYEIIERAKTSKKAVVIGGGLLGLEAAKAVVDLKLESHILEVAPTLMPVQLDPDAGKMLKSKIEAIGIKVHTGVKILGTETGPNGVTGIRILEDGKEYVQECDMIIVSTGIRPRQELAEDCGLDLGGAEGRPPSGIKVNHKLQCTNDPNCYAIGEVASLNGGMVYGMLSPGYQQAAVCVEHLCDANSTAKYDGSDLSTKLKLLGVDVASFGGSADFWFKRWYACDDAATVMNRVETDTEKGLYKKLVFTPDGKKLLGGILVGSVEEFTRLTSLSKQPDIGGLTPEDVMAGKTPKVNDGGDGTGLADSEDVCNCHCVKKSVIRQAIQGGCHDFASIKSATKAGTGCGSCISTGPQPKLLAHTLDKMGKTSIGMHRLLPFSAKEIEEIAKARGIKSFEALVEAIGVPGALQDKQIDACKEKMAPLIDRLFSGKKKGDGLDHLGQLKSLRQDLWEFVDEVNCNPIFLRLAWHDAGTYDKTKPSFPDRGGANGSIIYDPEINHGANNGLSKAVKYLESFKDDYPLVSWADLIQMAGAVGIEHAGGPKIRMKYGRKDVAGPEACPAHTSRGTAANAGLPDAEAPFGCGAPDAAGHLRNIFYRMGFNDQEIVALSGAHTIGRAFKERSGTVAEGYGEANACPYTRAVGVCPVRHDGMKGVGMPGGKSWTTKWLKFDNEYFQKHVYEEKDANLAWFSTDRALHQDDGFKPHFFRYRDDQNEFFKDFAAVMKKLSELGADWQAELYID
eukprot:TRINITY_DN384_c0_g1_i2.p1 TRINITY_DN384_c0_g1~~TRINITY_DN384_c0_g1_i2.p1  ORF type:complete len:932 (+),score=207.35 TRINITY_DN384_c0_g1_i2:58-2796(+)